MCVCVCACMRVVENITRLSSRFDIKGDRVLFSATLQRMPSVIPLGSY